LLPFHGSQYGSLALGIRAFDQFRKNFSPSETLWMAGGVIR
jgi:hypothetical protein